MHIGCEIVQGGMTNRPFHSLASIESERLVDERMILFRHMGESPDPSVCKVLTSAFITFEQVVQLYCPML